MADKDCRRQGERLHDFGHISAVSLNRALVRRARACAVPAQIDGDRLVTRREMRHLSVPVAMSAAKSVDEDDRRTALAGDYMVDERQCYHLQLLPPRLAWQASQEQYRPSHIWTEPRHCSPFELAAMSGGEVT